MTTQPAPGSPEWLCALAVARQHEVARHPSMLWEESDSRYAGGLRAAAERIDRAESELFTAQQTIMRVEAERGRLRGEATVSRSPDVEAAMTASRHQNKAYHGEHSFQFIGDLQILAQEVERLEAERDRLRGENALLTSEHDDYSPRVAELRRELAARKDAP